MDFAPEDDSHDAEVVKRFRDFLVVSHQQDRIQMGSEIVRPRTPANRYHYSLMAWKVGMVGRSGCYT